jgi:carbonic anhydrase
MSVTDDLLSNAESYAASFDKGDLPLPPARKVAVLACMDARLNPYGLLESGIIVVRFALRLGHGIGSPSTLSASRT